MTKNRKYLLMLLDKYKDKLQIKDINKVKKALSRDRLSWNMLMLEYDLLDLEYKEKEM